MRAVSDRGDPCNPCDPWNPVHAVGDRWAGCGAAELVRSVGESAELPGTDYTDLTDCTDFDRCYPRNPCNPWNPVQAVGDRWAGCGAAVMLPCVGESVELPGTEFTDCTDFDRCYPRNPCNPCNPVHAVNDRWAGCGAAVTLRCPSNTAELLGTDCTALTDCTDSDRCDPRNPCALQPAPGHLDGRLPLHRRWPRFAPELHRRESLGPESP